MNVLFLSSGPEPQMLKVVGDRTITILHQALVPDYPYDEPDFVISYNYHHIIRDPFLSRWKEKMINIHTSLLPWNRGASPNLWSWYDNTPKGVSIHWMDEGIDTGPLLIQRPVYFSGDHTLRSSYEVLQKEAGSLFADYWPAIKFRELKPIPWLGVGSSHTVKESKKLLSQFRNGYDTPCSQVIAEGRDGREAGPSVSAG